MSDPQTDEAMLKYALFEYIPRRCVEHTPFEQQDTCRKILDFKHGRKYAARWAAEEVGRALAAARLQDVVFICMPASCQRTYIRRCRAFSQMLCSRCGMTDGFNCIEVIGNRKKAHKGAARDASLVQNIVISSDLRGKKVLLFDDIYTTGATSNAFIDMLQAAGAQVCGAVFLGKTRRFCSSCRG